MNAKTKHVDDAASNMRQVSDHLGTGRIAAISAVVATQQADG